MKISSVDFLCKLRECSVWIATFFIRKVTLELREELKWFSSYPCVKKYHSLYEKMWHNAVFCMQHA